MKVTPKALRYIEVFFLPAAIGLAIEYPGLLWVAIAVALTVLLLEVPWTRLQDATPKSAEAADRGPDQRIPGSGHDQAHTVAKTISDRARSPQPTTILGDRLEADTVAAILSVVSTVTVIIPWLIGKWLKGSLFLPYSSEVWDGRAREGISYFGVEWGAGASATGLLLAVFLIRPSWKNRALSVSGAVILLVATGVWFVPATLKNMKDAERIAQSRLATGVDPATGSHLATCAKHPVIHYRAVTAPHDNHGGTVYLTRSSGDLSRSSAPCDMAVAYVGWTEVGRFTLPLGHRFAITAPNNASFVAPVTVVATAVGPLAESAFYAAVVIKPDMSTYLLGFALGSITKPWTYEDSDLVTLHGVAPHRKIIESYTHVFEGRHGLTGIDLRTGKQLWQLGCPQGERYGGFNNEVGDDGAMLYCEKAGGSGSYNRYLVNRDGTLKRS